jgi:dTDP-4-dehydrorhamnose reductase
VEPDVHAASSAAWPTAGAARLPLTVAVVGAHGLLGAAVVEAFAGRHNVVPLTRADVEVTDDDAVRRTMERLRPDVIVNCTACNDVDGAEDAPSRAFDVNAFAVKTLAAAAAAVDAVFVHYSSDFVFDGLSAVPYDEDDDPHPLGMYASSKLLGEIFAGHAPKHYVLRVESLFGWTASGPAPRGTVASMATAILERRTLRAFEDRTVTPTPILDCATATLGLLERDAPYGVYHCVATGVCTWTELAFELGRQLGVPADVVAVRTSDVQLRANRPKYCALSNRKLAALGIEMPSWQDALARYLAAVRQTGRLAPPSIVEAAAGGQGDR